MMQSEEDASSLKSYPSSNHHHHYDHHHRTGSSSGTGNGVSSTTTTPVSPVKKKVVAFGSDVSDDEQQDEDSELIVYMDESRLFNKHRNHYSSSNNTSSNSTVNNSSNQGSNDEELTAFENFSNSVSGTKISYSSRKRRVSVWIPTLSNGLISSLTAKITNTVEFDFNKKNLDSNASPMKEKKYVGYSIDITIGFNNDHTKCQWSVIRRYNEFKKFYSLLKKTCTNKDKFGLIKFPNKSPITSFNDSNLLEFRKKIFNEFLSSVISMASHETEEGKKISSFEFLIYYFLDIHNSPVSFLFDHPYGEVFKQINQFYQTTREEKRRLKRLIEIERNYDEEQESDNAQYLLREQEWYEYKFQRLEELNRELNELRLGGDDFFIDLKGKPHILSVDKLSSSLHIYLLSENTSDRLEHTFVQQIYIDSIQIIRECNSTYRGDGFEMIDIQLLNGESFQFYVFDRKELIYSVGAQVNQYKLAKAKFINYLVCTVLRLKKEKYDESNQIHEQDLMELYSLLKPDDPLTKRKSRQWINIGFQGDNPSTDFRGGGYMSLRMLLFFAQNESETMKLLLSDHADYPLCVSGINLFFTLCTLLDLDNISTSPTIESIEEKFPLFRFLCLLLKNNYEQDCEHLFGQAFILLCRLLHKIFIDECAGYMDYPNIVEKCKKLLEEALVKRPNDFDSLRVSLGLL
ncbi:predicted protein [Naegleria gruberi]|uniref:Predicted protein n=1 Tax=Naegleria gruberi TaxID=5762 RepID=D2VGB2_NAEGR|nr:uncharacterized protein NAEGRDRAFT_79878 [Naegleria gruberi]EFC44240.1 predicted protein [Naegleria gruberi]|eukprot:XP_002676984.1 predicted protein [Naegleria gruberi strain NEG-M]